MWTFQCWYRPERVTCAFPHWLQVYSPLSSMDSLVQHAAVVVFKKLPTFPVHVRPLPSVDLPNEGGQHPEGFPTLAAGVWPLSTVDSLVQDKCIFAGEGLPTLSTFEGFYACVTLLVHPQLRWTLQLPAGLAHVWYVSNVNFSVTNKGCILRGGVPTCWAAEGYPKLDLSWPLLC